MNEGLPAMAEAILGPISVPASTEPAPYQPPVLNEDTGMNERDIAKELPEAMARNGISPGDRTELLAMSKMLLGTVSSVAQLTHMITQAMIGAGSTGLDIQTPRDLLNFYTHSKGIQKAVYG